MKLRELKRRRCVVQMRRCWINAILRPRGALQRALRLMMDELRKLGKGQTPGSQID